MNIQEKLLHVFYQDERDRETIDEYIHSVSRLEELVVAELSEGLHPEVSNALYINGNRIHILPDWLENRPGILFHSEIPFNKRYFLGSVFGMLGNEEKYPGYFTDFPAMLFAFDLMHAIIQGKVADSALENILGRTLFSHPFENYIFNHNVAVALHFGHFSESINEDAIAAHYEDALQLAFEPSYKAFTLKYYAVFLTDNGNSRGAMKLIDQQPSSGAPHDYPWFARERAWCQAAMKNIQAPYDAAFMEILKARLWESVQFFDKQGHRTIAALLWMDAASVAAVTGSYSEGLGYINKSIQYLRDDGQPELVAQAQLVKGRLLHEWARSGNPQFYRSALEAFHESLGVFTKEDTPAVFADIHHQLGTIYAELPDENKKRSIWAALSATSFNEALEFFNKVDHPHEFGMICNNYANAFTKYPSGGKGDNFERALNYYNEALSVRSPGDSPVERSITLLNYLEASWKAGNPDDGFNWSRYNDMIEKAQEVRTLTSDSALLEEADKHLQLLQGLEKELKAGHAAI